MTEFPFGFPAFGGDLAPIRPLGGRAGEGHRVITDDQVVTVHTKRGVTLFEFDPENYTSVTWGRVSRDASRFDLVAPPDLTGIDRLAEVEPWRDWATVWDGSTNQTLWTGPVMSARDNSGGFAVSAKDHAAYLSRTRVGLTKRWEAADPATVAGALWEAMTAAQGLAAKPYVRPDPTGEQYDLAVKADTQMTDRALADLVEKGLRWSVICGTPVIGPLSLKPVATLSEDDFEGDGITFVKDGSATYNDVLVRGADNLARARVDYYDENLQTIVNIDNAFGVGNVQSAANDYVRLTGQVPVRLELGANTVLKASAPVTIDDLMPSARFVIEARGIRQLFELTAVDVERRQGAAQTKVTMVSVDPEPELTKANDQNSPTAGLSGGAAAR